jgi:Homeodomain-like domain
MKRLWQTLFQQLTSTPRERVHLALTTMALRHQLAVLQRSAKRPQFWPADRCLWVLFSMVWARWSEALEIAQADTVRRWRRQGFRQLVRWERGRQRPGRPAIAAEMRALIRRMSQENVLWSAPRIQGELAKLGVQVSRATIAKYMAQRPGPPSPTWRAFMRHHVYDLIASGAYADLARRLHSSYVTVMSALQRWLSSWTTRGGQRPSRRDVVPCTRLSDPASVPLFWSPDIMDRVGVAARSPPHPQSSYHDAPTPANVPIVVGTANVCLASLPLGGFGA